MSRSLWIVGIDRRGHYVTPRRLAVPPAIAAGDFEDVSSLELRELHRDIGHELARRSGEA
jgi:hypothetical protein